jgi:peptide-methionine (S)-S-oxide reductase
MRKLSATLLATSLAAGTFMAVLAVTAGHATPTATAEAAVAIPAPAEDLAAAPGAATETAVIAGGCFWGVQGVFQHVKGVTSAVSGYAGGDAAAASYSAIGSGRTGHAESVRITYDPRQISYGQLLQIYFSVAHNPTELNRQGPDRGTQYRSAIFPANDEQARVAKAYIAQLDKEKVFGQPIATTVEPAKAFYPAEAYHQDYMTRHPRQPYIVINDLPKVENLQRVFPTRYRTEPVLVGSAGSL